MNVSQIKNKIAEYKEAGKKIFVTSSFQTHSIPLLHIISNIDNNIPILFINTGFHFPETIIFRDKVAELLQLKLIDVKSMVSRNLQKDFKGRFYFASDPDYCCFINKTQPIEPFLAEYDIWINGVRSEQNANRKAMQAEMPAPKGCVRFHPILDWTSKMIYEYIREYNLPKHPLENQGYVSIGCEPCTRKIDLNDERAGRWFGLNKTECGLHTDLVNK